MIIGGDRYAVIENIKAAELSGDFYKKVETDDPNPSRERMREIVDNFCEGRKSASYKLKCAAARAGACALTLFLNKDTEIIGAEKLKNISGGAFITSNHFSPIENTAVRTLTHKIRRRLFIITQVSNLEMAGPIGFLMNYADTVPISDDPHYIEGEFLNILGEKINRGGCVLIYPEQEMWFNFRKPRPPKRGAYYFASKLSAPVISCFVEQIDTQKPESRPGFNKVKFRLHVLEVLTPSPEKTIRENSIFMCERDYALKTAAYERLYGKKLSYDFTPDDIAGWDGKSHEEG